MGVGAAVQDIQWEFGTIACMQQRYEWAVKCETIQWRAHEKKIGETNLKLIMSRKKKSHTYRFHGWWPLRFKIEANVFFDITEQPCDHAVTDHIIQGIKSYNLLY